MLWGWLLDYLLSHSLLRDKDVLSISEITIYRMQWIRYMHINDMAICKCYVWWNSIEIVGTLGFSLSALRLSYTHFRVLNELKILVIPWMFVWALGGFNLHTTNFSHNSHFTFYCASYWVLLNYHGNLKFSKNVTKITVGRHWPLWFILKIWSWNKFRYSLWKNNKSKGKRALYTIALI
jgi:hypothetical protein